MDAASDEAAWSRASPQYTHESGRNATRRRKRAFLPPGVAARLYVPCKKPAREIVPGPGGKRNVSAKNAIRPASTRGRTSSKSLARPPPKSFLMIHSLGMGARDCCLFRQPFAQTMIRVYARFRYHLHSARLVPRRRRFRETPGMFPGLHIPESVKEATGRFSICIPSNALLATPIIPVVPSRKTAA